MNSPNPHASSVPEYRFPKNASLPLAGDVVGDLAAFLPPNPEPPDSTDSYEWGRVIRTGTRIQVIPEKPGEFEFVVSANDANGNRHSVLCRLGVNGDPKSMRKNLPPPADAPFWKDNSDSFAEEFHRLTTHLARLWRTVRVVGASCRGSRHADEGRFRDDHMGFRFCKKRKCFFLAVADGGGAYRFAREGSRIAVESALSFLDEKSTGKDWKSIFEDGKTLMLATRHAAEDIIRFSKNTSLSELPKPDDFATTLLLAAVMWKSDGGFVIRTFSIGDGAIVWKSGTRGEQLCRPDFGPEASGTLFVTNREVWLTAQSNPEAFLQRSHFLEVSSDEALSGTLLLMSDGVSDPFFWGAKSFHSDEYWKEFFSTLGFKNGKDNPSGTPEEEKKRLMESLSFYRKRAADDRTLLMLRATGSGSEEVYHA